MKVKTKGILILILFFVLIGFFAINMILPKSTLTVSAATNLKSKISFDYLYRIGTDKTIIQALTKKETKVKQSQNLNCGENKNTEICFELIGEKLFSYNETENILYSNKLSIRINSDFDQKNLKIKDAEDNLVCSTDDYEINLTLKDGEYFCEYECVSSWKEQQNLSIVPRVARLICNFNIFISTEKPTGEFEYSEDDNSIMFRWVNNDWIALLDNKNYIKNSWIKEEGEHKLVLINSFGLQNTYEFKISHNYLIDYQLSASCTENGVIKYKCSQCGDIYEETQYATGHKYSIATMPPTCTESEHIIYQCSVCDDRYETEGNYPSGHSYVSTVTIAPTCTADGELKSVCEFCGDEYTTIIIANGHNYEITDTSSINGKTTRVYTCRDCGHSYKQELGNQYEEVSNYVEYLFEQYEPYMWWLLLASAGVWSIVIGVMIVIAQKNEDKEKARKMLINYVICLVLIAVIVVACPLLIRGIAALVT